MNYRGREIKGRGVTLYLMVSSFNWDVGGGKTILCLFVRLSLFFFSHCFREKEKHNKKYQIYKNFFDNLFIPKTMFSVFFKV